MKRNKLMLPIYQWPNYWNEIWIVWIHDSVYQNLLYTHVPYMLSWFNDFTSVLTLFDKCLGFTTAVCIVSVLYSKTK